MKLSAQLNAAKSPSRVNVRTTLSSSTVVKTRSTGAPKNALTFGQLAFINTPTNGDNMHLDEVKHLAAEIYILEAKKDGELSEKRAREFTKSMKFAETVLATWIAFRRLDLAKKD